MEDYFSMYPPFFRKDPQSSESGEESPCGSAEKRELRKWEAALRKREKQNAAMAAELERCREELEERAGMLERHQKELEARDAQLDKKERTLSKLKRAAEAAARQYSEERKVWSQWKSRAVQPVLEGHVQQLREDFRLVRSDLGGAQESVVRLMHQVQDIQNAGIEELCWLHREAAGDPSDEAQRFAARLAVILRESFGAEPVEPVPGDRYDSETCERESGTGDVITACLCRGWRWNGGIVRAYVAADETL